VLAPVSERSDPYREVFLQIADFQQWHLRNLEAGDIMTRFNLDQRWLCVRATGVSVPQRSRKWQPVGQSSGLGTIPGMACSRFFGAPRPGIELSSQLCKGVSGARR